MHREHKLATVARWHRIGLMLVGATLAYNTIEGILAMWAGVQASSIALVGFGLDNFIECASAGVVLWRLAIIAALCFPGSRSNHATPPFPPAAAILIPTGTSLASGVGCSRRVLASWTNAALTRKSPMEFRTFAARSSVLDRAVGRRKARKTKTSALLSDRLWMLSISRRTLLACQPATASPIIMAVLSPTAAPRSLR